MKFTRDGAVWTVTFASSILTFLLTQLSVLHKAFGLAPVWDDRMTFLSALAAMLAGLLKMSPLALSPQNTMAGSSKPMQTMNPITNNPTDGK